MIVVEGVSGLDPSLGRVFVVVGVFDGLHLGHAYLLDALVHEARVRGARPTVITFDHHPDAVITGSAPPLLCDPNERLERLAAAEVEIAVVHHFDAATRQTPYDAFIRSIAERVDLAGFLMTPDSAFGRDRGGTPESVAALGRELGYDVAVLETMELDGRAVRSTEIRAAVAQGDLATADRLLGRSYAIVGELDAAGRLRTAMPVQAPAPGAYTARLDEQPCLVTVTASGAIAVDGPIRPGPRVRLEFDRLARGVETA